MQANYVSSSVDTQIVGSELSLIANNMMVCFNNGISNQAIKFFKGYTRSFFFKITLYWSQSWSTCVQLYGCRR